jgi:hypothetical protein
LNSSKKHELAERTLILSLLEGSLFSVLPYQITPRNTLIAGSWLIALAIGLLVGRKSAPSADFTDETAIPNSPESAHASLSLDSPFYVAEARKVGRREITGGSISTANEEAIHQTMIELSDVLNVGNRIERTRQMIAFIDRIDNSEIADIVQNFREAGWVDYNRSEFSMLICAWMDRDPFTAISFLDQNETDGWTRKTAISAWAADSPKEAANAIRGLEDSGEVNDWVVGLIEGMARNDPDGALLALKDIEDSNTKNQAIREILPEVVIRGAEFAGKWIEKIRDPKLQRDTAKRLASSLARRDPESASDWIRNMTTVATRRDASEVVSEIYAQQDLDGAKLWAESLPQDTMTEAAEGVAKYLARKDPVEAAIWLRSLGNDPDLDGARFRFLQETGQQEPQTALENVSTLSRPKDQERYYRDILNRWHKTDQTAAIAWATANSEFLPEKVLKGIFPKPKKKKK